MNKEDEVRTRLRVDELVQRLLRKEPPRKGELAVDWLHRLRGMAEDQVRASQREHRIRERAVLAGACPLCGGELQVSAKEYGDRQPTRWWASCNCHPDTYCVEDDRLVHIESRQQCWAPW